MPINSEIQSWPEHEQEVATAQGFILLGVLNFFSLSKFKLKII